ncbi:GTPase [Oribacterium sp. P6A1]|uniref:GTPase n=1 Tax=Oribacterium sp. P6A1 TaxID=1410612 RepID=UPI0024181DEA|nr:GTPase [Oribacterium sp. P6A1]
MEDKMVKGNVLVIGNSGVGKSTLINAVLGKDAAKKAVTGRGIKGTTLELEIYENDGISFRLIDTIGFEPGFFKERKAINAVRKWSKDSTRAGKEDTRVNVIWFCVDGTSSKLFPKAIDSMMNATSIWKNVPIVVVITKSYSEPEREDNKQMIRDAFAVRKKYADRLNDIIPVVAEPYTLREGIYAPPEGITELIELTNRLLPEGFKAAEQDVKNYNLIRKRALSQTVISVATLAGITVGGVTLPFADAMILTPTETLEIESIAKIWDIKKNEQSKALLDTIVDVGTVGAAGKLLAGSLKTIPVINVGAAVVNAFIAGSIVFALGEGASYIFEQIYMGKKSLSDTEWVRKILEEKLTKSFLEGLTKALKNLPENADKKQILEMILKVFG